jgi:cell division protein FtsI/penicillin-binding protein 2
MACIASLVANKGVVYRPHLMKAIIALSRQKDSRIYKPEMMTRFDLPKSCWDQLQHGMVQVVERGTAQRCRTPGLVWGGKTGSAEHKKEQKTHSWFIAFAPADHPKIALAAVVEKAGHGGDLAAPLVKDLILEYLKVAHD